MSFSTWCKLRCVRDILIDLAFKKKKSSGREWGNKKVDVFHRGPVDCLCNVFRSEIICDHGYELAHCYKEQKTHRRAWEEMHVCPMDGLLWNWGMYFASFFLVSALLSWCYLWENSHNLGNHSRECMALPYVCISLGCHYAVPQTGRLTIDLYSLTVLEVRSPKLGCWQFHAPSKDSREESFLASPLFRWLLAILAFLGYSSLSPISVSISMWPSSRWVHLWVSTSLSPYKDTNHWT